MNELVLISVLKKAITIVVEFEDFEFGYGTSNDIKINKAIEYGLKKEDAIKIFGK
jgi:hypothetical protein